MRSHACLDPGCPRREDPEAECSTERRQRVRRFYARLRNLLRLAADHQASEESYHRIRRATALARIAALTARVEYRHPDEPYAPAAGGAKVELRVPTATCEVPDCERDGGPYLTADLVPIYLCSEHRRERPDLLRRPAEGGRRWALEDAASGVFRRPLHPSRRATLDRQLGNLQSTGADPEREAAVEALWRALDDFVEDRGTDRPGQEDVDRFLGFVDALPSQLGEEASRALLGEDRRRAAKREERSRSMDDPDWTGADARTGRGDPRFGAIDARLQLRRLMERADLTNGERDAVAHTELHDRSATEAAELMGSSASSVRVLKSRGMKKLRQVASTG